VQVLLVGIIMPSLHAPLVGMRSTPTTITTKADHSLRDCPLYGCPIYPPEIDDVMDELFKTEQGEDFKLPFGTKTMATLTKRSNRRNPPFNQDSLVYIDPFQTLWTQSFDSFFLAGTFDGHGDEGHLVAQVVARDLPNRLAQKLNNLFQTEHQLEDEAVIQTLKDTFIEVDIHLPPSAMKGGCTASVTLRIGSKLYVANAGDSRTIVVSAGTNDMSAAHTNTTIVYMNRLDKAHLPDELKRIQDLGGKVHIPPHNPEFSRVVVYSTVGREHIGLAMSRSLGDWEWKVVGVTAEPIVDVIDLKNISNPFLLTASDGLWDMRRPMFFAECFAASFYQQHEKHPLATCFDVIKAVTPKDESFYRDDISILAVQLEQVPK
jgi:serine/threonine protein phosphatase PrpC